MGVIDGLVVALLASDDEGGKLGFVDGLFDGPLAESSVRGIVNDVVSLNPNEAPWAMISPPNVSV